VDVGKNPRFEENKEITITRVRSEKDFSDCSELMWILKLGICDWIF